MRHVIFDWSGTLADDLPPVIEATNAVLVHYGAPPMDRETFRREFCLPFTEFYERVLPGVSIDELDPIFRKAFHASKAPVTALPHAEDLLAFCKATGRTVSLCSSTVRAGFDAQAGALGFDGYFDQVYAEVRNKEEGLPRILEECTFRADSTVYVGDMQHDVAAAKAAGVMSIAVLGGYDSAEELVAAEPDVLVSDLSHVQRLLASDSRPVATVGALITDARERVLMVRTHKWSDKWGIPGGKIRRGETAEAALRREIREETDLEIEDIRFVFVLDSIEPEEFYEPAHFLLMNYTARAEAGGEVRLNDEAEAYQWVTFCDALKKDLNVPTRKLIERVMRDAGGG